MVACKCCGASVTGCYGSVCEDCWAENQSKVVRHSTMVLPYEYLSDDDKQFLGWTIDPDLDEDDDYDEDEYDEPDDEEYD